MAVIAGHRAGELHLVELAPGGDACAVRHALGNIVTHHIQARIAAYDDILRGDAHQLGKQALALRDAVEHAVVAAIHPILRFHVGS